MLNASASSSVASFCLRENAQERPAGQMG